MNTLAIFDFDETLTTEETLWAGLKAVTSPKRFKFGMKIVSLFLPHFKKKRISSTVMKNIASFVFFAGMKQHEIENRAKAYLLNDISRIENEWHIEKFNWHKANKHEIVVVTANFNLWVEFWAIMYGVPCISTELATIGGRYTGFIIGKNNYDDEKIVRLCQKYDLENYDEIYAYTDSMTDKCLLDVATKGYLNGELFDR